MPLGFGEQRRGIDKIRSTGSETLQLIIDYVKQETLDPLKGLGRFVLFGVAGSVALAGGIVVLAVALLRFLQTETDGAFTGNLSWLPYLLTAVVVVGVGVVAGLAVNRGLARRSAADQRAKESL